MPWKGEERKRVAAQERWATRRGHGKLLAWLALPHSLGEKQSLSEGTGRGDREVVGLGKEIILGCEEKLESGISPLFLD